MQIRQRCVLERAGELQRHQEVGRLADAANEVVLHPHDGRRSGACGDGDVIESELVERVFDRDRAAESHAAVHLQIRLPLERDTHHFQEVLVPTNGDAVLGDAAESGQDAIVEWVPKLARVADRLVDVALGQRLDLQAVDGHNAEAFVRQVVRERVARRPEADDENVLAVVRQRHRTADVQRIPHREQRVDLEAPRQVEDVGHDARLDLRDVDRVLLLKNARAHAVVADAVARAGAHGVVDHHDRQRGDGLAAAAQHVHLADLLVERAPFQRNAQRVRLE